MKILPLMVFLMSTNALATNPKQKNADVAKFSQPTEVIYMGLRDTNKVVYYVKSADGKVQEVDRATAHSSLEGLIAEAKKQACSLSIRPETVELSVFGFASFSWETEKLCSSQAK